MGTEIRATRSATSIEWQRAFDGYERATFFHGPLWSEIWEAYRPGAFSSSPQWVEFSDGRTAVLGRTTERVGLGVDRHHLSPAGNYGGWVTADQLTREHARALCDLIRRHRGVVWRRSPADQEDRLVVPDVNNEVTHVIDLRGGAAGARSQWKREAGKEVRRAEKHGTRVRLAASAEDWLAYDALYRLSIERWDAPSSLYDRSFFLLLHELDSPAVQLWLAERDGRAVSGLVVFTAHRHAVEWHGASIGRDAKGASNLLKWYLLDVFEEKGIETYDLNPSGGHKGVVRFKETMGAVAVPAPILIQTHPLEATARRAVRWTRRLARRSRRRRR